MLKQCFTELVGKYVSPAEAENYWLEIEKNYSGSMRYYHTLGHLENLIVRLSEVKHLIADWETILFSVFYHDAVYNVLKHDNEEKSAALAGKRMNEMGIPSAKISKCLSQILATKDHKYSNDKDTDLLTDADLSILGSDSETYETYVKNVRKEYSVYPDLLYKPGRKKVLEHFLDMPAIYKTEVFANKYERMAKKNLSRELDLLK